MDRGLCEVCLSNNSSTGQPSIGINLAFEKADSVPKAMKMLHGLKIPQGTLNVKPYKDYVNWHFNEFAKEAKKDKTVGVISGIFVSFLEIHLAALKSDLKSKIIAMCGHFQSFSIVTVSSTELSESETVLYNWCPGVRVDSKAAIVRFKTPLQALQMRDKFHRAMYNNCVLTVSLTSAKVTEKDIRNFVPIQNHEWTFGTPLFNCALHEFKVSRTR